MSKTLNISWLGTCPECDNRILKVETEKGIGCFLYEGDKITCPQCGSAGSVDVDDGRAFAVWNNAEEAKHEY